jgi:fibronectin-binding autotransporter adhesin
LSAASSGATAANFTVRNSGGTINAGAFNLELTGGIANFAGDTAGPIAIDGTGSVTFSGNNTYTGSTTVLSGATLNLSGTSSIVNSSALVNNGTFSIAGTTGGASVVSMTGAGATNLGANTLTLTNAAGTYNGAFSGTGGITVVAGTQILSDANTHSGTTKVLAGATLQISSPAALGSSALVLEGTTTVSAILKTTTSMTISNAISVARDPTFNVAPATVLTIGTPITDGVAPGDVVVEGGGTLLLTAVNTYTGSTTINAASTLELSGAGSIAQSVGGTPVTGVTNNAIFKITAASTTVSLGGLYTQTAPASLLMNWNQRVTAGSAASLGGTLNLFNTLGSTLTAGRHTLMTAMGVTGTFASFDHSNLPTTFTYALAYDANNVYLGIAAIAPAVIPAIPTLSEWALVGLTGLMVLLALTAMRRGRSP